MFTINIKRIVFVLALAVLAIGSPYLIAKYKAINYASGKVNTPPAAAEAKPEEAESNMVSPDGKENLTVKKVTNGDAVSYQIATTKGLTYSKTLPKNQDLVVPFNTWSPDNKYLFLKENTGSANNFLVFYSNGAEFKDGSLSINVTDYFNEKLSDSFSLTDITGWADPVLLVVNTTEKESGSKVSFWFDLTSRSFIRLSSKF